MPSPSPSPSGPDAQVARERLRSLRRALLDLHKTLVESERITYEQAVGTIPSPNHFLKLLTTDPWFAWLHPLSLLLVAIDTALDEDPDPVTPEVVQALVKQAGVLLTPSEEGDGFPRSYFEALQRDPDVVLAHGAAARHWHPPRKTG